MEPLNQRWRPHILRLHRWAIGIAAVSLLAVSCGESPALYGGDGAPPPSAFVAPPTTARVTTTTRALTATVSPTTGLVHGQILKAAGDLGRLTWRTCAGEYCAVDEFTEDRDLTTAPRVVRVVLTPSGPVDCAERAGRCSLRVGGETVVDVPLEFRADSPVPWPALSLNSRDRLAASATVVASGVTTDEYPHLAQCRGDSGNAYENCRSLPVTEPVPVKTGGDGRFSRSVNLVSRFSFGEATIDCRTQACEVRLIIGADVAARVPITFA